MELWLREHSPSSRITLTDSAKHATSVLRQMPHESRVIIAGGDGTVNAALPVIRERRHVLGVLPLGSGNDTARALGTYGLDTATALSQLLASTPHDADLGELNIGGETTLFLSSLTAGFDAAVAARAHHGPKWLHGLPRYLLATFRELVSLRHWKIRIVGDDQALFEGVALFASTLNTPSFGSGMPAVPHAAIDDGKLNLLLARRFTRPGALAMLPRLLRGTHLRDARVSTHQFARMRVVSETPMPLCADGEFLGEANEFDVAVLKDAIRVIHLNRTQLQTATH
jgi:diacylglycerol kinase (ATP)